MNKETFLEELRGHLQILEDQEQQDILEEYAQHIDMKIQKGLSEEEAIKDFGPMKELAAGILEAYHVKPEYDGVKAAKKLPDLSRVKAADGGKAIRSAGGFLKRKLTALGRRIAGGFRWTKEKLRAFGLFVIKPFRKKNGEQDEGCLKRVRDEASADSDGKASWKRTAHFFAVLGRGIAAMWKAFLALCRWVLRLVWNLFWLFASLLSGILTLAALFGFGALVILMFQGYPLAGILLVCLGIILCGGTVSCGAFSLIKRKRQDVCLETGELEEEPKEVQYE